MLNKTLVLVKRFFVMRILLIIAFLVFPSIVFSGVGDVYFCESTKFIDLKNGEVIIYTNEKFKFKRTSNELIFGSEDSYLKNAELTSKNHDLGSELFSYKNDLDGKTTFIFSYKKGLFSFSQVTFDGVTSMTGKCLVF